MEHFNPKSGDMAFSAPLPLRLSEADAKIVLDLIDNPPAPNAVLARAFARRSELFGVGR